MDKLTPSSVAERNEHTIDCATKDDPAQTTP